MGGGAGIFPKKRLDNQPGNSYRYKESYFILWKNKRRLGTLPMREPKPQNIVQTIERAAFLVDLLRLSVNGPSPGDLACRAGLPKATVPPLRSLLVYMDLNRRKAATGSCMLFLGL
jgi:hypothetical protein